MTPAPATIDSYRAVVGDKRIDELFQLAERLPDKRITHVNSTSMGGGVAELLSRIVPLMRELGLEARWEVIRGGEDFFNVTKRFHNALHGNDIPFSKKDFAVFEETNRVNVPDVALSDGATVIHDPQPAGLIEARNHYTGPWLWRCHIDVSQPHPLVWEFLKQYVSRYDASIYSTPPFSRPDLAHRQFLIPPSIDPLSDKNVELSTEEIDAYLATYDIPRDKPLITQISRFDYLKDPLGVIEAFRIVRRRIDCQMLLAGGSAADDPESVEVHQKILEAAEGDPDIRVLDLPHDNRCINALQRASTVIVQKSIREGFGLTVTEALWKGKPVVAGAVGGIPQQVQNNLTGFLVYSAEGCAHRLRQLLHDPKLAERIGHLGREHVRNNFVVTRHLKDYLLMLHVLGGEKKRVLQL